MSERKRKWDQPATEDGSKAPKVESEDAGAAAAAIAARIAAQYGGAAGPSARTDGPKYERDKPELNDPDFIKDIDINDVRNRYLLTKGETQSTVFTETGCAVTTKGSWYPDRTMANDRDPPLYLHLTASTQEVLDKGIAKVQQLMDQDLGPLTESRRDRREPRERVKWPEHKLPISLENIRGFVVRAKVVGPGGMFVKYIQNETGSRVQIKGLGSGFIETDTGAEAPEPMHINITGPDDTMNLKAKELAEDLLHVVRDRWQEQSAANSGAPVGAGFGQPPPFGQQYPGYGSPAPPSGAPPPPPSEAPPPPPGQQPDYSSYYAQQYGQQQPQQQQQLTEEQQRYFNSPEYKAWYQQYLASLQQQQQQQAPPPPNGAAPPPPPSEAPPPPPS